MLVTPSIMFTGTHLYIRVERGTVRVICFAQKHNAMFLAWAQTWAAQSEDECTNHVVTSPLNKSFYNILENSPKKARVLIG